MNAIDQALAAVGTFLAAILGLLLALFGTLEDGLRGMMERAGLPHDVQTVALIVVAVLFVIAALRLLGGFLRLLIIVFLILLLLHIAMPGALQPHAIPA